MAWKNTEQLTFSDALFVEHDSIKEIDSIHELLNWHSLPYTFYILTAKPYPIK